MPLRSGRCECSQRAALTSARTNGVKWTLPTNSGEVCFVVRPWSEHDQSQLLEELPVFGRHQLSPATFSFSLRLLLGVLLEFSPHVDSDQSRSSSKTRVASEGCERSHTTCMKLVFHQLSNCSATVCCEKKPKRLKNAAIYNFFCLWSGPKKRKAKCRCESTWSPGTWKQNWTC